MFLLTFNSVIAGWTIILAVSSSVGVVVTMTLGRHLQPVVIPLSVVNIIAMATMVLLFMLPIKSEGEAYSYAYVASVLMIFLLSLLPINLMLWFVRLRKTR